MQYGILDLPHGRKKTTNWSMRDSTIGNAKTAKIMDIAIAMMMYTIDLGTITTLVVFFYSFCVLLAVGACFATH